MLSDEILWSAVSLEKETLRENDAKVAQTKGLHEASLWVVVQVQLQPGHLEVSHRCEGVHRSSLV